MNTHSMPYRLARVAIVTALLLMVPLVAMQTTDQVNWSGFDFAVAGTLLFSAGMAFELIASRGRDLAYRAGAALAVGTALFLVWSNLAVGLIGSEDNPANWMYIGVLAVEIAGAALARLQARGMARALFATALAQGLVAVVALVLGLDEARQIVGVNAFFIVLFCGSALLFRHAAAEQPRAGEGARS
jgi:hypothetical protein